MSSLSGSARRSNGFNRNPIRQVPPYQPPTLSPAKPVPTKPAPSSGLADGLILIVGGKPYRAVPIPREPGDGASVVVCLLKPDDTTYDVARTEWGLECTCPDFEFRHRDNGTHCKHIKACLKYGLLNPPIDDGWEDQARWAPTDMGDFTRAAIGRAVEDGAIDPY